MACGAAGGARSPRWQGRRRSCAAGAALALSALASTSGAEGPAPAGCKAALRASEDARGAGAEVLFEGYQCALAGREYARALDILERACAGSADPACAFNRALAYHTWLETPGEQELEHCRRARENYVAFLTQSPYDEQSAEARRALGELRQFCAVDLPAEPPAPAPVSGAIPALGADALPAALPPSSVPAKLELPPAPPPGAQPRGTLGWGLVGLGSAVAVAATLSWLRMARADADLLHNRNADGSLARTAENASLDRTRRHYQLLGWALGVAAVPLVGAGAVSLVIAPSPPASGSGAPAPGLLGVRYGTTF